MPPRNIASIVRAAPTSDGAGVKLRRSLGQTQAARLDPFLMLDEFSSDNPDDYLAGFPPHPHRGFETVTYMLDGQMLHEDHLGNRGELRAGGAQWMSAGRGIIHSEMPQQDSGRLHGFQLWINLPASEKMKPAAYRDIQPDQIPQADLGAGASARVVAGRLETDRMQWDGPVQGLATAPLFLDVRLPPDRSFQHPLPATHNAILYVYEGELIVGAAAQQRGLRAHEAALLGDGDALALCAGPQGARFLLLAARPLHEPVVQYGPFVMNSREEIDQALADYRNGVLV